MKSIDKIIDRIPAAQPVLIAGPTASGKSALALRLAETQGGVIVNADALQVFSCWRVLTARPAAAEIACAPHALYGHVDADQSYSVGDWLRALPPYLNGARPIITGGTGLYFTALTEGLAKIPPVAGEIRAEADALSLEAMLGGLDPATRAGLDEQNRARVQRAWEVQRATGRSIRDWQADTPPPLLPRRTCHAILLDAPKAWLNPRIAQRFAQMLDRGALSEVAAMLPDWQPGRASAKAIGAPELIAHLRGEISLETAQERAVIATRQYAKRQRSWFRARMRDWHLVSAPDL